jgi:hypothetical protein
MLRCVDMMKMLPRSYGLRCKLQRRLDFPG